MATFDSFISAVLFGGCGYITFTTKEHAIEGFNSLDYSWITREIWQSVQWIYDRDQKFSTMLQAAKAELKLTQEEEPHNWTSFYIAMQKKLIKLLEEKAAKWRSPIDYTMDNLTEEMEEENGWPTATKTSMQQALEDLKNGEVFGWDATRDFELVYCKGKLICATQDAGALEHEYTADNTEGLWFQGVLAPAKLPRLGKLVIDSEDDQFKVEQMFRNPSDHQRIEIVEGLVDTVAADSSIYTCPQPWIVKLPDTKIEVFVEPHNYVGLLAGIHFLRKCYSGTTMVRRFNSIWAIKRPRRSSTSPPVKLKRPGFTTSVFVVAS